MTFLIFIELTVVYLETKALLWLKSEVNSCACSFTSFEAVDFARVVFILPILFKLCLVKGLYICVPFNRARQWPPDIYGDKPLRIFKLGHLNGIVINPFQIVFR